MHRQTKHQWQIISLAPSTDDQKHQYQPSDLTRGEQFQFAVGLRVGGTQRESKIFLDNFFVGIKGCWRFYWHYTQNVLPNNSWILPQARRLETWMRFAFCMLLWRNRFNNQLWYLASLLLWLLTKNMGHQKSRLYGTTPLSHEVSMLHNKVRPGAPHPFL